MRDKIDKIEKKTKKNNNYILNIAFGYGGRQELLDSFRRLAYNIRVGNEVDIITETIEKYLYLASEPDLIIRTGGEIRTSNFLPWQSVYSEWFFVKKMWPEFTEEMLQKIIEDYHKRKRRYGT